MSERRFAATPVLVLLLGSALLTAQAVWNVPWREGLERPRSPLDRSTARILGPAFRLLATATAVVPAGATVVVRAEPPNPTLETWYYRFAVSLLPGRRPLPSAMLGGFTRPDVWREAEYIVLVGPHPREEPGELVLTAPQGTVWRRRKGRKG